MVFSFGNKIPYNRIELLNRAITLTLDPEFEATGGSQAGDRWRVDRHSETFTNRHHLGAGLGNNGRSLKFLLTTLGKIFKRDEEEASVTLELAVEQAIAIKSRDILDRRVVHEDLPGLRTDLLVSVLRKVYGPGLRVVLYTGAGGVVGSKLADEAGADTWVTDDELDQLADVVSWR